MGNLRDVRLRMKAISQTLQVTKAMNLISTAKLRKGRRTLQDTEPYFTRIQKSMLNILYNAGKVESDFFRKSKPNEDSRCAILVVTSDKGLAGGYNANVFRQVHNSCSCIKNPQLILVGSVGSRYFAQSPYLVLESFSFQSQMPTMENASEITDYIVSQFLWGAFDEVHVVYTHMYSSIKLLPKEKQLLPLDIEQFQKDYSDERDIKKHEMQYEFIPSKKSVFDALVPMYIKGMIYGSLVEAYVSEQSARMFAMDEASKSAEDMLASLQISYNRARQAGITQEMSEIIGGSSALAGK
jgi:F-type H+-transporting ATPase subunit gamma